MIDNQQRENSRHRQRPSLLPGISYNNHQEAARVAGGLDRGIYMHPATMKTALRLDKLTYIDINEAS
jgi:hypothetical protein